MNSTLLFLTFIACFAVGFAAVAQIPADPERPGVCVYEEKELEKGPNDWPDQCIQLECHEDGSITQNSCGKVAIDGCTEGDLIDVSQPYPQCCKRNFNCKDEDGADIVKEL